MRRLLVLIDGLPDDAAAWRKERAAEAQADTGWRTEHELAAVQIERAEQWFQGLWQLLHAKPSQVPKQIVMQHPGRPVPERKKPTTDPAQIQAFFAAMKG